MPGIIGNPLSALTARILFDGTDVGTLQELTVEEDFNVRQVNQIGSNIPAEFLPGTQTGRIIAARAMLEGDLLWDKLTPSLVPGADLTELIKGAIDNSGELELNPVSDILEQAYDIYEALFLGRVTGDRATFVVYFNVEILDPNDNIIAKFNKCTLTARTLSITIGNIIVMQNITMLFGSREY